MKRLHTILRIGILLLMGMVGSPAVGQHYVQIGGDIDTLLFLPRLGGDSAYLVNEALTVKENGTLKIEAGTKVYFMQSASLRVDGGSLLLEGARHDSVSLLCYEFSHDWAGIQLKNADEEKTIQLSHVVVVGALTALAATSCSDADIRHCTFNNYYAGKGIEMVDCNNFVIDSCSFSNCVSGIELKARSGDSRGNLISHNLFDRGQINIEVSNIGYGFKCDDNHIVGNCFQGATTAVSFETVGGISDKEAVNYISDNLISSALPEGGSGYSSFGVKAAMDSLVILNNVFWNNDEAVSMTRVCRIHLEGNTFYGNRSVITNILEMGMIRFVGNTVSEPTGRIATFPSGKSVLHGNNFLHVGQDNVLFANASAEDVDIRWNHWGTQSAEEIEALIVDKNDNPALGEIIYEGFLAECDTVAPVSPPFKVKRQLVDGSWLISWDDNPESDIDHYVLFYGDFNFYKFKHHIDSITETSCRLNSQQIGDVAVMACDRAYLPQAYATAGQSAYAFASYYPYAGGEGRLCAPETDFVLQDANIPYTYNRFVWRTSGSGRFSDTLALRSRYYPSESDFNNGEVWLTLHVMSGGEEKTDEFHLCLYKRLEVFAGADSYGGMERPVVTDQATASNYDSLRWHSNGDGWFEDPLALTAVYHPGEADKERGFVELVLEAWSVCGHVSDIVRFDLFKDFSLEGRTWADGKPRPQAHVVAAALSDDNPFVSGFYRTMSDNEGFFRFDALLPDTYILYAFPDTLDGNAGGAYYLGQWQWNESNMIDVSGNVYDVDLTLPATLTGFANGTGRIEGWFEIPDLDPKAREFYCTPWLRDDAETDYCTEGLSNVGIALLNATKQRILAFTLTDAAGHFRFSRLPFGTYHVMADLPRYGRGMVQAITLAPENPECQALCLYITREGRVAMRQPTELIGETAIAAVPNPGSDLVSIVGLNAFESCSVAVHDATGAVAMPAQMHCTDGRGICTITVGSLPKGVYCIVVKGMSENAIVKFVKY